MKDVHIVSIPVPDPAGDDKQLFLMKAPKDSYGGGITIVGAEAVNGTATNSGTTFTYQLLKYSNAGTPAVNGTISSAIGGTAAPWGDAVPKDFDPTHIFMDAEEWLVLDYQEVGSGNPTNSVINIHYVMGK